MLNTSFNVLMKIQTVVFLCQINYYLCKRITYTIKFLFIGSSIFKINKVFYKKLIFFMYNLPKKFLSYVKTNTVHLKFLYKMIYDLNFRSKKIFYL